MKRSPLRKKSNQSISLIQRKLWEECKRIIRARYKPICYTCGATGLTGANFQTGHLFPKASLGAYLKYDLRVLRPQCFACNIHRGGEGALFIEYMRAEEGNAYVDKIIKDRQVSVKAYDWYVQLLEKYKQIEK